MGASDISGLDVSPVIAGVVVAEVDRPILAKLRKDARVQSVYKDELSLPTLDSTTTLIRSNRANDAGWTGRGTTVAILDMGIDRDHPFFAGRLVDEACFSSSDAADGSAQQPGGVRMNLHGDVDAVAFYAGQVIYFARRRRDRRLRS